MTQIKYITLSVLTLALISCGQEKPAGTVAEPETTATKSTPNLITLTAEQIQTAGIQWGNMESKPGNAGLNVTGELRVHNEYISTVSAWAEGTIAELRTGINKPVSKGTVIAVIRQPQLLDWQQDYLETQNRLSFLEAEYARYKTLKDDNATALKNFQKAESEWREAQTRRDLLAAKLKMYQIDASSLKADNVSGNFELRAPVSGIITRTFVTPGSAVQSGTPVCEIVDMSQLHADLFVFEKDLGKVQVGQKIQFHALGKESVPMYAIIFSIDPGVDPERKAIRVHARFTEKPMSNLVNGAYVEGLIHQTPGDAMAALPSDAIIREDNHHYIFVLDKETTDAVTFRKIPVNASPAQEGYLIVEPNEILPANIQVVKKGAYYVAAQGAGISVEE